jgi:hypothetical protein
MPTDLRNWIGIWIHLPKYEFHISTSGNG